jgi:hypothetical protein
MIRLKILIRHGCLLNTLLFIWLFVWSVLEPKMHLPIIDNTWKISSFHIFKLNPVIYISGNFITFYDNSKILELKPYNLCVVWSSIFTLKPEIAHIWLKLHSNCPISLVLNWKLHDHKAFISKSTLLFILSLRFST